MSLLPQYKIGDCSIEGCGLKDTECRKVGKELICAWHYSDSKKKEQIKKAYARQSVRGLIKYERQTGVLDSTQELILDLDRVVSRYLRLREMAKDGKCQCFTCSTRKDWRKVHAGHFIPRTNLYYRWDLTYNLHIQCPNCNVTLRGNYDEYAKRLEAERKGIVAWMQETVREVYSPTRDELKQLLFDFQNKLKLVETKLK